VDEADEHDVELLKATEDSAKALESPKQSLDLVAPLVHLPVVLPGLNPVGLGRHYRHKPQVQCQLARLVAFVRTVHQQVNRPAGFAQVGNKLAPFERIVRLAG